MKIRTLFLPVLLGGLLAVGFAAVPAGIAMSGSDKGPDCQTQTPALAAGVPATRESGLSGEPRSLTVRKRIDNSFRLTSRANDHIAILNRLGRIDYIAGLALAEAGVAEPVSAGVPRNFTQLSVEGYTFSNEPGLPRLPERVEMIEVPQGAVPRVVYTNVSYKDIDLAEAGFPDPLYPAQLPVSKSAKELPAFRYDASAYASNVFSGRGRAGLKSSESENEGLVTVNVLGEMRGTRLAKLIVSPFRYNAATHTLRVYTTLDFEVVFDHADMEATYQKKNRYFSPVFRGLEKNVLNPISVEKVQAGQKGPSAKSERYSRPIRYAIVADPMFRDSLQVLVNWKTRFGFDVIQAYTDQPEVGTTKESIYAYLKGLYDNATEVEPAPSYVLLVGDLAQIPTKKFGGVYGEAGHYSDLYLGEYTGDHFPDVQYGRMSATSVEELMPQIRKTIEMESIAPERAAFLDTTVIIAGVDSRFGNSHLNPTIDYIHSLYMKDTLQRHGYKYSYPESGKHSDNIIQNINDGISVIIYTAHGYDDSWSDPYIDNEDVNTRFANKGKYPLMIGNCCLSGKFDVASCFGETLMRKKDAGAAVYIGGSNSTYFDHDVYWAIGYTKRLANGVVQTYEGTELGANDALYHTHGEPYSDWALSAYEIVHTGNMAVERANQDLEEYYWQVYHVFGDPSYMPYTHRPSEISAQYDREIVVGESDYRVVTVPYARVVLSRNGKIYGIANADENGVADVVLEGVDTPEMLELTIVAQNHVPLMTEVEVISPEAKYVILSDQVLTGSDGSEIRKGLYGEDYKAVYTIKSVGKDAVGKVTMKLVSADEYVSVDNADYILEEELTPGTEKEVAHEFTLRISPDVPDNYTVKYVMEMVLDDETQKITKEYMLAVNAPDVQIAGFKIDDSASSNPNGVIDNGETVKGIVTLVNRSSIAATDVKVKVTSSAAWLNLPEAEFEAGDLAMSETKTVSFEYSAKDAGVYYAPYTIDFEFDTKGRKMKGEVQSYIEPVTETFESGDFSFVAWEASSDWLIDESCVHNGKYSASSSPIGDRDTSRLAIVVDVLMDDVVGFYYRTSSELVNGVLGDFLNFFIDGQRMDRWAGTDPVWKYAEYPVSAGRHTFEWLYLKDESDNGGDDKVWVDDIRLPIGSHEPVGTVANEEAAEVPAFSSLMTVNRAGYGSLTLTFLTETELSGNLYLVNTLGQRVKDLATGLRIAAGSQTATFGIEGLSDGMYICVFDDMQGMRHAVKFVLAK